MGGFYMDCSQIPTIYIAEHIRPVATELFNHIATYNGFIKYENDRDRFKSIFYNSIKYLPV